MSKLPKRNPRAPHDYPTATDGDWINPVHNGFRMRCCDCDLIHVINFRVSKGHIKMQVFRDNRATASARRRKKK